MGPRNREAPMNSVDAGILAQAVMVVETPPRDPLPDGTCVGPYRIRSLIASGGMGDVYRAHDERLARDVALKVLPTGLTDDRERLRPEEVHYIAMELVEGETLREFLIPQPPLARRLEVLAQTADGLGKAHA